MQWKIGRRKWFYLSWRAGFVPDELGVRIGDVEAQVHQ